jgi:hypothetical protein
MNISDELEQAGRELPFTLSVLLVVAVVAVLVILLPPTDTMLIRGGM